MIRILVVEDEILTRDSLVFLISAQNDLEVVGSVGRASEAIRLCSQLTPDLVIMGVCTENNESGIAAAKQIKTSFPMIKVMLMTSMPEITYLESSKFAGVDSFLYKNVKGETFLATIRSTVAGYGTFPKEPPSVLPGNPQFSETEMAIIRLVCKTKSRCEIAKELAMSEGSVKGAITRILNKTGYDSIMKFAVYAVSKGYINPHIK